MIESTLCYLEKNGSYLMLHRTKKEIDCNKGKWIGIGGKREPKESIPDCLYREVREETGIRLRSAEPRGIITFHSDRWESERMFLFTSKDFEGEVDRICDEGDLAWVKIEAVTELTLWEGDRIFLQKLRDGDPFFFLRLGYTGDELTEVHVGGETFRERIYEETARVPRGSVISYGELAALAGYPGAARACGNALHDNPYDGVIPCHRVVNARGFLAKNFGFGGPLEQQLRLEEEGVEVIGGRVRMK